MHNCYRYCTFYIHINTVHPTNNNRTAHRRHKGHRRDHFLGVSCAEKITPLDYASGAKPQRRRPENFGIELKCDLLQRRKRTRALAYALMRAAERRTPCEQQTDSTRHVRVLFAAGDTPHEVFSLLLSTSDALSEFRSSAQRQQRSGACDSFWFLWL